MVRTDVWQFDEQGDVKCFVVKKQSMAALPVFTKGLSMIGGYDN
jgi:hypothetical protein